MKKAESAFVYAAAVPDPGRPSVVKQGKTVIFTAAAEGNKSCELLLYKKGSGFAETVIPMPSQPAYGDLRSVQVEKLPMEQYEYNFRIDGKVVPDPGARYLAGSRVWGTEEKEEKRCGVITDRFDWAGDVPLQRPFEECILYTAHVRGLTMHPSSRVRHKGTFRGVQEKIPYLKELGINQLELMPVYEFEEIKPREEVQMSMQDPFSRGGDRINYWGYGPACYFAPKASYSSSDNPVREFKNLVKALHQNGIELILEFYFPKRTDPGMILECLRFWIVEYHIDGFHVNREGTPLAAIARDPLLSRTKILSEGFPMDDIYDWNETPAFRHLAECHDGFQVTARRFLKGEEGMLSGFAEAVRRNGDRNAAINYISSHNGFTLADLVSYDEKHNEENGEDNRDGSDYNFSWNCGEEGPCRTRKIQKLRQQQCRNALAMVLLSQGTPMIHSGDELGNSQQGNNNVYCQDNETGWVSWNNGKAGRELQQYVKKLIAFRREHPMLSQARPLRFGDYLACGFPDISYHGSRAWYGGFEQGSRHLGMLYAGIYADEPDTFCYAAYNMHWIPHELALPLLPKNQKWYVALDTGREEDQGFYPAGEELLLKEQRTIEVPARTIMVLIGR